MSHTDPRRVGGRPWIRREWDILWKKKASPDAPHEGVDAYQTYIAGKHATELRAAARRAKQQRRRRGSAIANCTHAAVREGFAAMPDRTLPPHLRGKPVQCTCGRWFNHQMQEVPEPTWAREAREQDDERRRALIAQQPRARRRFFFVWWN